MESNGPRGFPNGNSVLIILIYCLFIYHMVLPSPYLDSALKDHSFLVGWGTI